jgi:hypothetical protein
MTAIAAEERRALFDGGMYRIYHINIFASLQKYVMRKEDCDIDSYATAIIRKSVPTNH